MKNVEFVNFQRNGITGAGFFTAIFEDADRRLMATFESDDTGELIKTSTCRVNNRDDLRSSWRGDYYADKLNAWLVKKELTLLSANQFWQSSTTQTHLNTIDFHPECVTEADGDLDPQYDGARGR